MINYKIWWVNQRKMAIEQREIVIEPRKRVIQPYLAKLAYITIGEFYGLVYGMPRVFMDVDGISVYL